MAGPRTKHQVPRTMNKDTSTADFTAALDALLPQLQADRSILAALLAGSLSHDRVWEKSDIDMLLVTVDDKLAGPPYVSLNADGVNVHAMLMQRAEFRKLAEGSVHQSFMHSFLAKSRVLFTYDDTIRDLCQRLQRIGQRDTSLALLRAGTHVLPSLYKARKFLLTRGDLEYTALWILYAATPLAQVEVISARRLVDREVILEAMTLNPEFFKTVYTDLLNAKKTRSTVKAALDAIDGYLADRTTALFQPIIDHLREAGEARSCTEIEDHFKRNFDVGGVTAACEYLADQGHIGKAATGGRLTRKSNVEVQELAFFYTDAHG